MMASAAGSSQQQAAQPKFGKNLFKSRIASTGTQLETDATVAEPPPPSGLSPDDYDYNPFYIGNQGAASSGQELRSPSPIVCDNFNPHFSPPDRSSGQAKTAAGDKAASRRSMINEMLQEMQRLSPSSGSAGLATSSVSFGSGSGGGRADELPDLATFSVRAGNAGGEIDGDVISGGVSGTACGSDEPMDFGFGSVSSGGACSSSSCGIQADEAGAGCATFSVKVGDDVSGRAVAGTACGSDEPMQTTTSTSAYCGVGSDDLIDNGGFGSQATEAAIRVETKLLRFLNDPMVTEFRFEGRMQPADRRAVRWFAKERGLFFKEVALRTHERAYVVKKPYAMAKEQQARHREAQRAEARRLLLEASQSDAKKQPEQPSSGTGSGGVGSSSICTGSASFGIKVGGDEGDPAGATIASSDACIETEQDQPPPDQAGRLAAPRRDNWCQTIPEENFLCYLCQEEVPLVIKAVHIGTCLANQRQQLRQDRAEAERELEQLARRQAQLGRHRRPGDRRKAAVRQALEADKERLADRLAEMGQRQAALHHAGSGQQSQKPQQQQQRLAKVRPFESVHANDIERLLAEARQLDKFCRVRDCGGRLGTDCSPCDACGARFCPQHADGPAHGCSKRGGSGGGGNSGGGSGAAAANGAGASSVPTKFERNKLRQGLRDRLAMMAERRK